MKVKSKWNQLEPHIGGYASAIITDKGKLINVVTTPISLLSKQEHFKQIKSKIKKVKLCTIK